MRRVLQRHRSAARLTRPARVSAQELTATGHRTWGSWKDGRGLLNIKIYDFALYVDKEQVRAGRPSRAHPKRPSDDGEGGANSAPGG